MELECPFSGELSLTTNRKQLSIPSLTIINFLKDLIYLFLEIGEGREKEKEKHQCAVASSTPPTGSLACNPAMCPDWESNWHPFGSQASAQSTEPQQPVLNIIGFNILHKAN